MDWNLDVNSLNLGNNDIGAEGAERLAAALERNTTLTSLNLGFNGIGAQMAERLARALDLNRGGIRVVTVNSVAWLYPQILYI